VSEPEAWLEAETRAFSDKVGGLLARCFPNAPNMRVTVLNGKAWIRPDGQWVDEQGREHGGVPLHVKGVPLDWLRVTYSCC
jgi:hypothetical protein